MNTTDLLLSIVIALQVFIGYLLMKKNRIKMNWDRNYKLPETFDFLRKTDDFLPKDFIPEKKCSITAIDNAIEKTKSNSIKNTVEQTRQLIDEATEDFIKKVCTIADQCDTPIWIMPLTSGSFAFDKKCMKLYNPLVISMRLSPVEVYKGLDRYKFGGPNDESNE